VLVAGRGRADRDVCEAAAVEVVDLDGDACVDEGLADPQDVGFGDRVDAGEKPEKRHDLAAGTDDEVVLAVAPILGLGYR
jgi:hypothetical protein